MKPRIVIFTLILAPVLLAQDPTEKRNLKPATVVARKGTLRQTLGAKGSFAPADPAELKLEMKSYRGELKLLAVKEHGSMVAAGDIIARIDPEGIERQLITDRMGLERAELDWAQAQERKRMSDETNKARLERAERDYQRARMKLDGFLKHEKEHRKETERLGIEGAKHRLENQHDELVQLEKMYSEDELVDATEEIVLKRSRRSYARAKAYYDLNERRRLYRKEFYEEWKEEDIRRDVAGQKRSLEHTIKSLDMAEKKSKLDMASKAYGLKRTRERFADLENDRKQFVVRAPRAGMLLHSGMPLKKGGSLRSRSVFAKIADPGKLLVKTMVMEKDILSVKNGMACEITPVAAPDKKIVGRLKVDALPTKGMFAAEIAFDTKNRSLKPGMNCSVAMILAEARDVVIVPRSAVSKDGDKSVVKLASGETRAVTTGISDGNDIAILEGLQAGEKVVK